MQQKCLRHLPLQSDVVVTGDDERRKLHLEITWVIACHFGMASASARPSRLARRVGSGSSIVAFTGFGFIYSAALLFLRRVGSGSTAVVLMCFISFSAAILGLRELWAVAARLPLLLVCISFGAAVPFGLREGWAVPALLPCSVGARRSFVDVASSFTFVDFVLIDMFGCDLSASALPFGLREVDWYGRRVEHSN